MELKCKKKCSIHVDYHDLEEFLTRRFDLPEFGYEFAVIEECNNDTIRSINVCKEEADSYDQKYIDAVTKDKKPLTYGTRTILCYLCNLGEIPEGEYLIEVSW